MLATLKRWLDDRTGLISALAHFMNEAVPRSTGWRNTLGSLAGALLLLQILSGVLLALYYVPHPEAAYESVKYIEEGVSAGWFVRALHFWGASFIVIAIFCHMVRVFLSGAYKKPREMTWIAGVCLLFVVLGTAFTGQLLPWNQMGYWAANVGIEIASTAPLIGPAVGQLMLGGEAIGALTLTRFYALHVVALPLALGLFVILHLYLLRRHGPLRTPRDTSNATISFFPAQLARDLVVISIGLGALGVVSYVFAGPDHGPADPADTDFVPHPEWYFQAHYQILKLTPGPLKILATFVIPTLFVALLLALPWLDRAKSPAISARRVVVGGGLVVIAAIIGLTIFGVASQPGAAERAEVLGGEETYDMIAAGLEVYEKEQCRKCHVIGVDGRDKGPDLSHTGLRLKEDYLREFLRDPQKFVPDTEMPPTQVNDKEFNELVAYLLSLKNMPEL